MESRRYFHRVPARIRGRALLAGSLGALLLLSFGSGGYAQQGQPPQAKGSAVPTLDSLPGQPLPRGEFRGWCGLSDKILMKADEGIQIYDGDVAASSHSFSYHVKLECGDDGQKMAYIDDDAGLVSEVDIPSGTVTRTLVSFRGRQVSRPTISFSPNLKGFASDQPLVLGSKAADLKPILLQVKDVIEVRWSRDSSEFFVISYARRRSAPFVVYVLNAQQQVIASSTLPGDLLFRDGWLTSSQALYLYLGSLHDEMGPGVILKCRIKNWKCEKVATNVIAASVGGDGVLGIVRPIGKYLRTDTAEENPPKYLVELRSEASKILATQTVKSSERLNPKLDIAPSGTKAVLTWSSGSAPGCTPEEQAQISCHSGTIIDLSGGLK